MRCVSCGAENPEGMSYCGKCGKDLSTPPVTPGPVQTRHCTGCGRVISWDANVCQFCGRDFRPGATAPAKKGGDPRELVVTGSILVLLASVLSITMLTIILVVDGAASGAALAMYAVFYACAAMGLVGGISAIMRFNYPLSVLGAACSIVGPAFFFGIPGLVLVAQSSSEFSTLRQGAG